MVDTQSEKTRRLTVWLLLGAVLMIMALVAMLEFRHREWLDDVAAIESNGGLIYGRSRAPLWLQRLRSDELNYLGWTYEMSEPRWLSEYLPIDRVLQYCDKVERIDFGTYSGEHVVTNLSGMQNVYVYYGEDHPIRPSVLQDLNAFPDLEELNLVRTGVGNGGLSCLENLRSLRWLSLEDNPITDEGLQHLSKLTDLEELLLSDTEITDEGLTHLENLTRLRRLDLNDTKITDAGLNSLRHLVNLEVLDLGETEIDGSNLHQLKHLDKLKWLNLRNTDIDDVGSVELESLSELRYLNVLFTDITADGARRLQHLKNLKQLESSYALNESQQESSGLEPYESTLSLDLGHYVDILDLINDPRFQGMPGTRIYPAEGVPAEGAGRGSQNGGGGFF